MSKQMSMNVLMISGDTRLLEAGSEAQARLALQRAHVDRLDVFVWPQVHTCRAVLYAARRTHYDVVTAQDPFWRGLLAWRVARRAQARLNIQVHADLSGQSFCRRTLARFVLVRATSVRVVSEKLREQVKMLGTTARVSVLPIYVDVSQFQNVAPKPHPQKTILWIGRFELEKDPQYAIQILREVRATGIDAKMVMLGTGRLESAVKRLAKTLPVAFPGWQDPKSYLQTADVVLCTSKNESWGVSIIEALAAGCPVVAPDVGVAREAGAVVVPRNELSQAVIRILRSGERGQLKIHVLNAPEWARQWRETLT